MMCWERFVSDHIILQRSGGRILSLRGARCWHDYPGRWYLTRSVAQALCKWKEVEFPPPGMQTILDHDGVEYSIENHKDRWFILNVPTRQLAIRK